MLGRLNINRIMPHEIRKECGGCGMSKPVSEFHNSSVNEDGKQNRCKVCQRVYREKRKGEVKIVEREKKTVDMVLYRREYLSSCRLKEDLLFQVSAARPFHRPKYRLSNP